MRQIVIIGILVNILILVNFTNAQAQYDPTWESLESRPIPNWYDTSKIGIFIHWGVYSVPAFAGYKDYASHYAAWFWNDWYYGSTEHLEFMSKHYPPNFTYQDFAAKFKAEFFDPYQWAEIFKKAGAKYIVLTSKHHEGYSLYPSKYGFSWNSQDTGPNRDLVGDLAKALRETTDIKFGLYHSRYEFFNPLFLSDKRNGFHTDEFVQYKTLPELYELVNLYKPDVVWSDGEFDAHSDYWKSKEFLAWLYNESPVNATVVSNDRWGNETLCRHGGFMTCADHFNPGVLQPRKWESCMTLDKHAFSIRRNAKISDYLTPEELMKVMIEVVSCGGNFLINVGPSAAGMIVSIQEERLMQMGEWLELNGAAIYDSVPWEFQNDTLTQGVWYTANPTRNQVYGFLVNWPGQQVHLGAVDPTIVSSIEIFGTPGTLQWTSAFPHGIIVQLPRPDNNASKWAWTLAITLK